MSSMPMCISAWQRISKTKKPKILFRVCSCCFSTALTSRTSGIRVHETIGVGRTGPGLRRSILRLAVQTLTEKADNQQTPLEQSKEANGFSLSKKVINGDAVGRIEQVQVLQKKARSFKPLLYGVGAAAMLLGSTFFMPVEFDHQRTHSLEESASGIGNIIASSLQVMASKITTSATEVMDAVATAVVLMKCLVSVLESYGEGAARRWWRARVASFLADVSAAGGDRRRAVVSAGHGAVVDWLLEVAGKNQGEGSKVTQSEAARALSYLLADETTCETVLARQHALPYLLRFAASLPANLRTQNYKQRKRVILEGSKGKSQLVASIMDIITESSEASSEGNGGFRPKLPVSADPADIAAALEVLEEGGLQLDDDPKDDGHDKTGFHGIGMKIVGGTGLIGLQRFEHSFIGELLMSLRSMLTIQPVKKEHSSKFNLIDSHQDKDLGSYGLWDDLQGRFVAVPLAAWAIATWAESSNANRSTIAKLDKDGTALMAAVLAPERTVKWHGALTMRLLLENKKAPSDDVIVQWSSALLDMAVQACHNQDFSLANSAITAFTACYKESKAVQLNMLEMALPVMRELAKLTEEDASVQKALAHALQVSTENGLKLPLEESEKWCGVLLRWLCSRQSEKTTRISAGSVLQQAIKDLGYGGIPVSQLWLAMLLVDLVRNELVKKKSPAAISKEVKAKGLLQSQVTQAAIQAAIQLGKMVHLEARAGNDIPVSRIAAELPLAELLPEDILLGLPQKNGSKEQLPANAVIEAASAVLKATKALTDLSAEEPVHQKRIIEAGGLALLRRFMLSDDYEEWHLSEINDRKDHAKRETDIRETTLQLRRQAARLLMVLTQHHIASNIVADDKEWCKWLQACADGGICDCDLKLRSYAQMILLNITQSKMEWNSKVRKGSGRDLVEGVWPRYEDMIFLLNVDSKYWKKQTASCVSDKDEDDGSKTTAAAAAAAADNADDVVVGGGDDAPIMDVVFIHGLAGGPIKTWRVAENKSSTTGKGGLVEKIDEQAGREGTCWPFEWLAQDFPHTRMLSVKYKTNFSEWSGATLPLEEVSSMLLDKLLAAGVGERPVVFITHSMGGLVMKQMLLQAMKDKSRSYIADQTVGVVFYSCPHFGSKLADMPWRMGYVLRPAPSIAELRSGSPRLEELNRCIRNLHYRGTLQVLSFSETKVTPLVEGYGGWALRMEVVPIESAYPGYGELVVLDGTDHVNSCKPLSPNDPAYTKTLDFLRKIQIHLLTAPPK